MRVLFMHACMHACMYVMYVHIYLCMYVCMCVYKYVCMYACMYVVRSECSSYLAGGSRTRIIVFGYFLLYCYIITILPYAKPSQ
jgi:hypothetical protein